MTDLPPSGWYRDHAGSQELLRYWDGSAWAEGVSQEALPEPSPQGGSPWNTYRSDLKWSAATLRSSPFLVIVSLGLVAVFDLGARQVIRPTAVSGLLTLIVEVFLVGFVGAQRVWFLRKLEGVRFEPREVWTVSWQFFGRFLCLGLLGAVLLLPIVIPIIVATDRPHTVSTSAVPISSWITVSVVIWSFVVDVALTFVVPALTLNVRSVQSAIALGWKVTRRTWPTNAWYMFAPGVTVVALAAVLPRSVASTGIYLCVGMISTLVSLWFKGAIVAFYVRSLSPASADGSASL